MTKSRSTTPQIPAEPAIAHPSGAPRPPAFPCPDWCTTGRPHDEAGGSVMHRCVVGSVAIEDGSLMLVGVTAFHDHEALDAPRVVMGDDGLTPDQADLIAAMLTAATTVVREATSCR